MFEKTFLIYHKNCKNTIWQQTSWQKKKKNVKHVQIQRILISSNIPGFFWGKNSGHKNSPVTDI